MKGLIKKDLLLLKNNSKMFIMLLIIYLICSIEADGLESFLVPFMMSMLCISTFSYDEYNKWDAYALTLPESRKNIIKAKYAVGLLMIASSFIVTLLLSIIFGTIRGKLDISNSLNYSLIGIASGLTVISFIFPLIIKFGLEKGRIGIMIASFGFSALMMLLGSIVKIPESTITFLETYATVLVLLVAGLLFTGSYIISKKIYEKKEF